MKELKRGQIWYCSFGESKGSEQGGNRPCVIIQNNKGNEFSPTTIVAVITTKFKRLLPTHVPVATSKKPSIVMCEQIKTINTDRLMDFIGDVSKSEIILINNALKISIGI